MIHHGIRQGVRQIIAPGPADASFCLADTLAHLVEHITLLLLV
jgi:hypothetical protein